MWLQQVELGLRRRRPLSAHGKPGIADRRAPLEPSLHMNVRHTAELGGKLAQGQREAAEAMWRDWRQQKDSDLRQRQRAERAKTARDDMREREACAARRAEANACFEAWCTKKSKEKRREDEVKKRFDTKMRVRLARAQMQKQLKGAHRGKNIRQHGQSQKRRQKQGHEQRHPRSSSASAAAPTPFWSEKNFYSDARALAEVERPAASLYRLGVVLDLVLRGLGGEGGSADTWAPWRQVRAVFCDADLPERLGRAECRMREANVENIAASSTSVQNGDAEGSVLFNSELLRAALQVVGGSAEQAVNAADQSLPREDTDAARRASEARAARRTEACRRKAQWRGVTEVRFRLKPLKPLEVRGCDGK